MSRRSTFTTLAIALMLLPSFTFAQQTQLRLASASTGLEAIAKARTAGNALIAKSEAPSLFGNETIAGNIIQVRHTASNLVCLFDPNAVNSIIVIPRIPPRSQDVVCIAPTGRMLIIYFAKQIPGATVEAELSNIVASINENPGTKPWKPSTPIPQALSSEQAVSAMEGTATVWFKTNERGSPAIIRVSVAVVNGWVIQMRARVPEADVKSVELLLYAQWLGTVLHLREHRSGDATSAAKAF